MTRTWPTGSGRRYLVARDSGTNSAVRTIAAIPTGMLTQKMPRQPIESTSAPPTTGPSATLRPNTPPQAPIARARSAGSVNVLVMMDIATGLSIEPPTAWNVLRRPIRSAVEPENIKRLASTSAYASIVHCSPDTDACSSRPIDGSATFTIVLSRPTMNRLMQQMPSTSRRRRRLSSGKQITSLVRDHVPSTCAHATICQEQLNDRQPSSPGHSHDKEMLVTACPPRPPPFPCAGHGLGQRLHGVSDR